MKDAETAEPKVETFHLKPNETQLLVIIHQNQQAVFAATLSNIAQDRLGYRVTERTQFKLSSDMSSIEVSEVPAPEVPVNPAENADAANPSEPTNSPQKPTKPDTAPIVTA